MKKITFHTAALFCAVLLLGFQMAKAQTTFFELGTVPEWREGNPADYSSTVAHTGIDAATDNNGFMLEAYVYDGTNPTVVANDGSLVSSQALPSTATDPDVAITEESGVFYVNVVYIDGGSYYYKKFPFISSSLNSASATYNLSSIASITGTPNGPNIDASDLLAEGAITFQDGSNNVYACVIGSFGVGSMQWITNGIEPDIAFSSDNYAYIAYVDPSNTTQVDVISGALTTSSYGPSTTTNAITSFNSVSEHKPRIACNRNEFSTITYGNNWAVVCYDYFFDATLGNIYHIYGATGTSDFSTITPSVNVFQQVNYTSAMPNGVNPGFPWASVLYTQLPLADHDIVNIDPVVSFERNYYTSTPNNIQIAWTISTNSNSSMLIDQYNITPTGRPNLKSVAGLFADMYGQPIATTFTYNSTYPSAYQLIPSTTLMTGSTSICPPPALPSAGSFNTSGSLQYGIQSTPSVAGKNFASAYNGCFQCYNPTGPYYQTTFPYSFISCFFDEGYIIGCNDEMLIKDTYNSFWGFRKSNTTKTTDAALTTNNNVQIDISPNPFSEDIALKTTDMTKSCSLILTDVSGRELLNVTNDITTLNTQLNNITNKLSAGIYFIKIMDGSNTVLNQKVVKM